MTVKYEITKKEEKRILQSATFNLNNSNSLYSMVRYDFFIKHCKANGYDATQEGFAQALGAIIMRAQKRLLIKLPYTKVGNDPAHMYTPEAYQIIKEEIEIAHKEGGRVMKKFRIKEEVKEEVKAVKEEVVKETTSDEREWKSASCSWSFLELEVYRLYITAMQKGKFLAACSEPGEFRKVPSSRGPAFHSYNIYSPAVIDRINNNPEWAMEIYMRVVK